MALPQSPETRRLDRHPDAARAARDRVLDRMVEEHQVAPEDARAGQGRAGAEAAQADADPGAAFVRCSAMATVKDTPVIRLTLDASLQKVLEPLARDRAMALGPNISVGIIVVDNASGEVLARVGSAGLFRRQRGQGRST